MAESFFHLLKQLRETLNVQPADDDARANVSDYIEMLYNPVRSQGNNQSLSSVGFEKQSLRHGL